MKRSLSQALADFESRLRQARSPILGGLRPGLSADEVRRRFATARMTPADDLVGLYEWHDGANGAGPPAELLDTARFLSLDEAIDCRRFELGLAAEIASDELIAAEMFHPEWFPVLSDASGRIYVVDKVGAGRVMIVDRMAIGAHEILGDSLVAFFDSLAVDGRDFKPPPLTSDVAILVSRFESPDNVERLRAKDELVRKRPAAAFDPLVAMLDSGDFTARRSAALILGLLRDRRAIPILISYMARWSASGPEGRKDATSAWGGLRDVTDEGVQAHLERALAEGDSALRLDAIAGLVFTGDATGIPTLQAAASHDDDPAVRAAAQEALRTLGAGR